MSGAREVAAGLRDAVGEFDRIHRAKLRVLKIHGTDEPDVWSTRLLLLAAGSDRAGHRLEIKVEYDAEVRAPVDASLGGTRAIERLEMVSERRIASPDG